MRLFKAVYSRVCLKQFIVVNYQMLYQYVKTSSFDHVRYYSIVMK